MALGVLMLCHFSTLAFAQRSDSVIFRNEISVNTKHYLLFMAGARTSPYHHITYTRMFEGFNLRFGLDYKYPSNNTALDQYSRYTDHFLRLPFEQVTYSDTEFGRYSADYTLSALRFRPGFEYVSGSEKFMHMIGFDALAGVVSAVSTLHLTNFRLDQNRNPVAISSEEISEARNHSLMRLLGVSPFYGMKYKFTDRLGLAVRIGFEVYNVKGDIRYRDDKGFTYLKRVDEYEVYSRGVLNDVSIIFQY